MSMAKALTRVIFWFDVAICLAIGIFFIVLKNSTTKETEIIINEDGFDIKGMFGVSYPYDDLETVELKDTLPRTIRKDNGSWLGEVKKGDFTVEEIGKCKLFVLSDNGPFVFIKTTEGYIIINYEDGNKTQQLYQELSDKMIKQ